MNVQALAQLVPPLRGCALCVHGMDRDGVRHCYAPAVRQVFGMQPVATARSCVEACGPGAAHMHMDAWSATA